MSKNRKPEEQNLNINIRLALLQQAQRILEQKSQITLQRSQGKEGEAPTSEEIISEAEKLYSFVNK